MNSKQKVIVEDNLVFNKWTTHVLDEYYNSHDKVYEQLLRVFNDQILEYFKRRETLIPTTLFKPNNLINVVSGFNMQLHELGYPIKYTLIPLLIHSTYNTFNANFNTGLTLNITSPKVNTETLKKAHIISSQVKLGIYYTVPSAINLTRLLFLMDAFDFVFEKKIPELKQLCKLIYMSFSSPVTLGVLPEKVISAILA